MQANNLTIVLTLKDRTPFTYRWMQYMNDMKCPYKILIADGGKDKSIEEHLLDPSNYPELIYEYIRYPYDAWQQRIHGSITVNHKPKSSIRRKNGSVQN